MEEGPDSYSTEAYPNGFTLTCTFSYDSGYVQGDTNRDGDRDIPQQSPQHDQPKLSFFANSGIKIWGNYEISIFDTAQLFGLTNFAVDPESSFVSADDHWPNEEISRLMTGVHYAEPIEGYSNMTDYLRAVADGASNLYLATLQNNKARFVSGGTMTITFKPSGNAYEVKTYVGEGTSPENLVYFNPSAQVPSGDPRIRLQTHWDSGVKFTKMTIGAPPE